MMELEEKLVEVFISFLKITCGCGGEFQLIDHYYKCRECKHEIEVNI